MTGRLKKSRPTRRDAVDAARLKLQGDPAHINAGEARLLAETMPESHGRVVTRGLLAEAGRRGDDRVTLLIPEEAALLKARGGAGTVNPRSGLLEYNNSGDSDTDDSDNTSNAGENTGGMSGAPGSGVAGPEGPGTGRGDGPGESGNYGSGAFSYGYDAYNGRPSTPSVESLLAAPNFAMPGVKMTQYAPPDTWGRVLQEYFSPHPGLTRAAPGRYGAPTAVGPGIMGTMAGFLTGQPMSAMMGIGAAMGRASSPATQAASAAEMSARGSMNSTGAERDHAGLSIAELERNFGGAAPAGTASGAQTAELAAGNAAGIATAPGYAVNAAGQVVPTGGGRNAATGLPTPVENLLYDYIWRGRSGGGFGW